MLYEYTHVTSMAGTPEPLGRQTIKKEYEKSPREQPAPQRRSAHVAGLRRRQRARIVGLGRRHRRHREHVRPPHERHGHDAYPTIQIGDHKIFVFRIHRLECPGYLHPAVTLREMSESVSSFARRGRALSFRGKGVVTSRRDSCERGTDERTHYTDEA